MSLLLQSVYTNIFFSLNYDVIFIPSQRALFKKFESFITYIVNRIYSRIIYSYTAISRESIDVPWKIIAPQIIY